MSSPLNVFINEQEDDCEDIKEYSFSISFDELKKSMQDPEPFIKNQQDCDAIKEILNLNDKSTLCNKEDDCKEILYILRAKNESARNLSTLINLQNFNSRKVINIKGNLLINSINYCNSTYSNSPCRNDNLNDENSVRETSTPVRLSSNFAKRVVFHYINFS